MSRFHLPIGSAFALSAVAFLSGVLGTPVHSQITGAWIIGTVDEITIDDPADMWSGGSMTVSGQVVILPRNLLIDLPANRMTLQQLFAQAPPSALGLGRSGLAVFDGGTGGFATILGNRSSSGNVIAGDVFLEKGTETVNGTVTYIDFTDGYLRIDGIPGDPATGEMIRINDPDGRMTVQQGLGCNGGPNCSPDVRFGVDPDNYTITFTTGYPAGIPSTVPVGLRSGVRGGDDPAAAADASGAGDPFCPQTNRGTTVVPDSTRFAPIRMGDKLNASGNFEHFGAGQRFLSCHSMTVFDRLSTRNDPSQPDFLIIDETGWDVAAFENLRLFAIVIGFSTLPTSQIDVFALHVDPNTNQNNEFPLMSTVGNFDTINTGVAPNAANSFKIRYLLDFLDPLAPIDPRRSPCQILANAGLPNDCSIGTGTLAENFALLAPISREMIGRTRRTMNPGVEVRDLNGNSAPFGEYLTPVGVGHPEFGEIDLGRLDTPFIFSGLPWNLDRRLGPGGCDGGCEGTPQPLSPFPFSGREPAINVPAGTRSEIFSFFPFNPGNVLTWPPASPPAMPIVPTRIPPALGLLPVAPVAGFTEALAGTGPVTASFTDASTNGSTRLWDFGDGAFSTLANPVHVYSVDGTYDVTLTSLGTGGTSTLSKPGLVVVSGVGGPGAPSAAFAAAPTAGNVPLPVTFTDQSTGDITAWSWSFGDGATSTAQSPSHTYVAEGAYSVTLTVTGPGGSDTRAIAGLISATAVGGLVIDFTAVGATTGPAPFRLRVRAINVEGTAISGEFDFGDGGTATVGVNNGRAVHTYSTAGIFTVTLTATDGINTDVEQKVGFVTVTAPRIGSK